MEDGEIDTFMINKTIGMDEEDIEALFHDIPQVTQNDVEALADYICKRLK